MSSWSFQYFRTDISNAIIVDTQDVTNIIDDFQFEETVGDEFFIKSGDLSLKMLTPLPYQDIGTHHNWLAAYWGGTLYNVYSIGNQTYYDKSFESLDKKTGLYETRLPSIQSFFYRNLQQFIITFSSSSISWAFNLTAARVVIEKIRTDISPETYVLNRWGFSPGNMILNMVGKTQALGFKITSAAVTVPVKLASNMPVIFRGQSLDQGDSEDKAVAQAFTDDGVPWKSIFDSILTSTNSFLRVTANITAGVLGIDISMAPRVVVTPGIPVDALWRERKLERYRYQVRGVRLTGANVDYQQGNVFGDNVFSVSLPLGNPTTSIGVSDTNLYQADGDYVSPTAETYSILDGGNLNKGWFNSGNLSSWYQGMIDTGHGYSGEINFEGQKVLEQTQVDGDTIQFLTMRINRRNVAEVEGIVI